MTKHENTDCTVNTILRKLEWEYSMIQTKIDKYGDIAFKIKGLLIPIASGSIYLSWGKQDILIPIFGIVATFIFLYYETINNIHRRILSERVIFIERVLNYKALQRKFEDSSLMPYQAPCFARDLSKGGNVSIKQILYSLKKEWRSNILYYFLILTYLMLFIFLIFKLRMCL